MGTDVPAIWSEGAGPVGPRSTTMTHPPRSMGIIPLRRYYEAPAFRYFQPHGWSRLCLYGLSIVKRFQSGDLFLAFLIGFFVGSAIPFLRPPQYRKSRRAPGAVKVVRRTNLSTPCALARPYLDSSEHGGTLNAVGMTIRGGARFRSRGSIALQPFVRWIKRSEP
jgi:hypothetical protein